MAAEYLLDHICPGSIAHGPQENFGLVGLSQEDQNIRVKGQGFKGEKAT